MHTDCSRLFSGVVFKREKKNRAHEWVRCFDERWTEQFPERLPEQFPECVHFGGKRQAFAIVAKTFKEYKDVHLTLSISILWIQWLIFTSKRFRKSHKAACSPRTFVMTSSTLSLLCAAAVLRDETSPVNNWSVMHAVVFFFGFFFKEGVELNYLHFNTHRYQEWVLNKAFLCMFFANKFNCDTNTHLLSCICTYNWYRCRGISTYFMRKSRVLHPTISTDTQYWYRYSRIPSKKKMLEEQVQI